MKGGGGGRQRVVGLLERANRAGRFAPVELLAGAAVHHLHAHHEGGGADDVHARAHQAADAEQDRQVLDAGRGVAAGEAPGVRELLGRLLGRHQVEAGGGQPSHQTAFELGAQRFARAFAAQAKGGDGHPLGCARARRIQQ